MADWQIVTCVIMVTLQQCATVQMTKKFSRFEKADHRIDIDSHNSSLFETLTDLSLKECARESAFHPFLQWFGYNSQRRECYTSLCVDILTQGQGNSSSVLYRKHGVPAPRSCSDVKSESPDAEDGEYWIYPDAPTFLGCPTRIYCHNMATETPAEYVSLPVPNLGEFPNKKNFQCLGEIPWDDGRSGITIFNKIAIQINTMIVSRYDYTFATGTGTKYPYGQAHDCYNVAYYPECGPVGTFNINMEGTGMLINKQITWSASGHYQFPPNVTRSTDGRQIDLLCGGFCGGCFPDGGLQLHRDPLADLMPQEESLKSQDY